MEYEDLCRLDVLGLKGPAVGDQEQVYNDVTSSNVFSGR